MFGAAERLLARCGMGFRDVVRTWIYLRDIDRDYDALNRARREFFQRHGIEPRPASTGVQGGPFPDAHDFSIRLEAVRSARPLAITPMSTPTLNEAWSYGADFSRGLRVADANKVALYISGTASIDEAGRTVHLGDVAAQVERMLHNIATLLAGQGATFADLVSGVLVPEAPRRRAGAARAVPRSAASTASRARWSRRRCAGPSCSARRKRWPCFLLSRQRRRYPRMPRSGRSVVIAASVRSRSRRPCSSPAAIASPARGRSCRRGRRGHGRGCRSRIRRRAPCSRPRSSPRPFVWKDETARRRPLVRGGARRRRRRGAARGGRRAALAPVRGPLAARSSSAARSATPR